MWAALGVFSVIQNLLALSTDSILHAAQAALDVFAVGEAAAG